jgi:MSHA biogenesis protein MshJ
VKARLQQQWQRFMARPLRERVLVIAGLAALVLMLGDRLWTGPAWAERQAAQAQAATARQALADLQAGLQQQTQQRDEQRRLQAAERAQLQQQLAELRAQQPALLSSEGALALLESLVARQQGRVQMVALTALPAPAEVASAAPRLYRHGLQLVVQGRYAALHAYLLQLAQEPRLQVRGFQLAVREHPELELSLQIETLSTQAAWLTL